MIGRCAPGALWPRRSGRHKMYWIAGGLFVFGAACGAVIGLLLFIGILIGVAVLTMIATMAHGIGVGLLNAFLAVVVLQIGYAAGFILRAAIQRF